MPKRSPADYYHEELESVPEQTGRRPVVHKYGHRTGWITGRQQLQQVSFAPHLPPSWNEVTVRHLRVGRL